MSLRDLYQEIIIDHGKQPRNFGALAAANHHQEGYNPLCGDKIIVHVLMNNGMVIDARFEGEGCAISVASASLMTDAVKGKSLSEIQSLFQGFHNFVTEGKEPEQDIGKLIAFSGVSQFPMRVKCATLAWHTLNAALTNQAKPVTTE
jgi:nitrogen fixation protein NifU and related proteins